MSRTPRPTTPLAAGHLVTGRLGRFAKMARVGARTGAGLLLNRGSDAMAEHAAEVLGSLRGLAAKVGQLTSYVDGLVPEQHREAFERAMSALQAAAPASSPEEIARVVEEDLDGPLDQLFAEWEREPFASASIGQVHRATLHDGRRVAVKVQHAGIRKAVESDLKNAGIVEGLIGSMGPRRINPKQVFNEIRQRFMEELDYEKEADHLERFRRIHDNVAKIRIPGVVPSRSSQRVLTTDLILGATLEEAARAPLSLRRTYAEVLWRFVFRSVLVGGHFNADPHPGNYLFHEDGSITFLDFGCVQPVGAEHLERARVVHQAALERNEVAFGRAVANLIRSRGGEYERVALDYVRRCFEPMFQSEFHITRPWVAGIVGDIQLLKRTMFAKDRSFVALPEGMTFMNRLQFGFYSVLARLDTPASYSQIEREILSEIASRPAI